jgi:hypothetical protein
LRTVGAGRALRVRTQTCALTQGPAIFFLAEDGGTIVDVAARQPERVALRFLGKGCLAEWVFCRDSPCLNENLIIVIALRQTNSQTRNLSLLSPIDVLVR